MAAPPDVDSDFEAWARVAAQLRLHGAAAQRAILDGLGLDEERWREINEDWSRLLNEDISAGRTGRPERYAAICRHDFAERTHEAIQRLRRALSDAPETARAAPWEPMTLRQKDEPKPAPAFQRVATQVSPHVSPHVARDGDTDPAGSAEMVDAARQAELGSLWTVEQFAELACALDAHPERSDQLWRRAGISNPLARPHVLAHWKRVLATDPALAARYAAYREQR